MMSDEAGPSDASSRVDAPPRTERVPNPRLSVVMPVHNKAAYVDASVASILDQTFRDFEFVIGDNGSTDGTRERLEEWRKRDARIRLVVHPQRLGPARSSNWVVAQSRGELIARMDADDVAHPERLARQMEALALRPEADLIGTLFDSIDEDGRAVRPPAYHLLSADCVSPPFCHPSTLFRRESFERVGGYRERACYWEDVDLFWRLADTGSIFVIAAPLMTVRHTRTSSRSAERPEVVEEAIHAFYGARAAFEAGSRPILPNGHRAADGRGPRLCPQVFASRAATAVWAGRRPRMLGRMLRRAAFRLDRATAQAVIYVLFASVWPRGLRALLVRRIRRLNRGCRFAETNLVRWRAGRLEALSGEAGPTALPPAQ